ncbi:DoxX family membrane protein [[Mycobacterium] vasticus]|uniref:DoxX family membrane protein n=1 Tax=[Mycobacterium] vasticus TaxID=2875777 RepID=A0ABU5Z591_9MYCO|nr:DoxX family membrane protein [Mycolicibacter sp. MYC017]MEB3071374.1 DoxX family membrane protein [Mycolicibacter sp. MYC017]
MTSQGEGSRWRKPDETADAGKRRPKSARLVDPEDDMPSPTYTGDFETAAIPPYDPTGARGIGGDYHPLPYAEPQPAGGRLSGAIDADEPFRAVDRRGTQDLGLLILRLGLGILLVAHGLRQLFGWWGGAGLNGFQDSISAAGYQHADILTYAAGGGQIAAGLLLVLGLFTPLAAAGALAYLINGVLAGVSHEQGRFAVFLPEGHEFHLMLIVVAVAIVLVGPGRYGLDGDRGWARRPFIGSVASLLLGIAGGVAMWAFLNGANPLS